MDSRDEIFLSHEDKKINFSREKLLASIIRSLFDKSENQLKDVITLLNTGVKLYDSPNGFFCNVPIEIIKHDEHIGPQSCINYTDDGELTSPDGPVLPSDIGFTEFKLRPTYETLFSNYFIKTAEVYVPHDDYALCHIDQVEMYGDGPFFYEGYIVYTKYNGSVSYVYTSKSDKENNINRFVILTRQLFKIVHKDELEYQKREKIAIRNAQMRKYAKEESNEFA